MSKIYHVSKFPWKKPIGKYSHYADDGPNEPVDFEVNGVLLHVAPTSHMGINTMRRRFLVRCLTCQVTIHEATTGATPRCESHLREAHPKVML